MLSLTNISTGYGKKQVLFDVSLEVAAKQITVLAGNNGSGKSTLFKVVCGLLPSWNQGSIWFNGEDVTSRSPGDLLRKGLLYIPQKGNLFEGLSVRENLEVAGIVLGQKLLRERTKEVLEEFPVLKGFQNRNVRYLSGGERQQLVLAMAFLHRPRMLLLDEPFTGLSPQIVQTIAVKLQSLRNVSGTGILLIEHRLRECLSFTEEIIGLKLGKVAQRIVPKNEKDLELLKEIFI